MTGDTDNYIIILRGWLVSAFFICKLASVTVRLSFDIRH